MSLPSGGADASRQFRALSVGSHSSPRLIPGSSDSVYDGLNEQGESNHGSFRGRAGDKKPSGPREPTRSSVHLSYRGPSAPIDSALYTRSVREETVELASYALSDKASARSVSPPRQRFAQTNLESYFSQSPDNDTGSGRIGEGVHRDVIKEVSEPVSPESEGSNISHSRSALTNLIRRSPPSTSPPERIIGIEEEEPAEVHLRPDEDTGNPRLIAMSDGVEVDATERTPLLERSSAFEPRRPDYIGGEQDLEGETPRRRTTWPKVRNVLLWPRTRGVEIAHTVVHPKTWDHKVIFKYTVLEPVGYMPAVVLGLLLNILDALSYGMILFPLGQPIFEKLGAAGISMFYVSCIVSQLVYSLGGSAFKGGIGSEMIEVVPFFHKMAFTIIDLVGEENPEAVIATTITSYAISSMITGIVFFLMGMFNFGYIVGFIPRHILIGCIGGVGFFLIATGLEVSARLEGNLEYNLPTLKALLTADTVALWLIPLLLACFLYWSQKRVDNKYYLPMYIMTIPAVFYFFVFSIDKLEPSTLRHTGWIFDGPEEGEPWWYFYTLYDFSIVRWDAVAQCIPAMFALTFFGILHVPINVPALAFSCGVDNLNLDRELIAHGVSNVLSGMVGSIQNYLVYTNSVLFMRTGGTERMAGLLLAVATAVIMIYGLGIIGYIPVMMVGTLIFVLGMELLLEAVWDPRNKLKPLEYWTVIAIVVIMGAYDFVVGIFVGIGLAFVTMVFQTSRVPAVRASYSGEVAGSTVRRNPAQDKFLREVGRQIHVTKLAGYLFFGTIVSVEERIRSLIEENAFNARPIRFLIFDLNYVTGIDYSAAEAFNRINRLFSAKGVQLVMSGVSSEGNIGSSLLAVGLGSEGNAVNLFPDLNSALESCENELLKTFYASKEARTTRNAPLDVPSSDQKSHTPSHTLDTQFSSPRRSHLRRAATSALNETHEERTIHFAPPLGLLLQTFSGLTTKNEDFWFPIKPYFKNCTFSAGTILYHRNSPATGFYLLESGILRADYMLPQGTYFESIVAGTTCGELPFFSETERTATVVAERDCVAWLLDRKSWEELQEKEGEIANELLRISLKLTSERMSAITSYVLTTAG